MTVQAQHAGTHGSSEDDQFEERIKPAVTLWGRSIFGAPRQLHALITAIEPSDDVIDRVATHVERRQFREVRSSTSERRSTRPRIDPQTADPFAYGDSTIKADSEYVTQCAGCAASGRMPCGGCRGTGRGSCPTCRGTGKQASPKTGRPIQCRSCGATGSMPCRNCAGHGSIPCNACLGSGHQLAWLTIERSDRWEVVAPANSPLVITHAILRQGRLVGRAELATVQILHEQVADGPLDLRTIELENRRVVVEQCERIDPRLERIRHQQYMKLSALRRDVTYEMCGTRGTLSLSGTRLVGATTPGALRPIRRRLYLWFTACAGVLFGGIALGSAMLGSSSYFRSVHTGVVALASLALCCAIPAIGTVLRAWRGGTRFHPMRWPTGAWAAAAILALIMIPVVALATRPDLAEASNAIGADDIPRARAVIEAYKELHGSADATIDLEDQILLAEARRMQSPDRLRLLDEVAAHKGKVAAQAEREASAERLDEARQLIAMHKGTEAIAALDRAFPNDKTPLVAEERARAHEAMKSACATPACKFDEARQADAAHTTPERVAALATARSEALQALDPKRVDTKQVLPRLQQLRQLRDVAADALNIARDDAELKAHADNAISFAKAERAKVPLLTNNLAVAEELIGPSTPSTEGIPVIALDGAMLYLVLDRTGRCTGVYAAGTDPAARAIKSPDNILSQTLGIPAGMQPPSTAHPAVQWSAGGAPIVARWDAGELIELRIGNATP